MQLNPISFHLFTSSPKKFLTGNSGALLALSTIRSSQYALSGALPCGRFDPSVATAVELHLSYSSVLLSKNYIIDEGRNLIHLEKNNLLIRVSSTVHPSLSDYGLHVSRTYTWNQSQECIQAMTNAD